MRMGLSELSSLELQDRMDRIWQNCYWIRDMKCTDLLGVHLLSTQQELTICTEIDMRCVHICHILYCFMIELQTGVKMFLHYGDLSDSTNLFHIIAEVRPHEVYNLGAMSHVAVSTLFEYS